MAINLYEREQPVAGPSSRPYTPPTTRPLAIATPRVQSCPFGQQCPYDYASSRSQVNVVEIAPGPRLSAKGKGRRDVKRQDEPSSSSASQSSSPLFAGPTTETSYTYSLVTSVASPTSASTSGVYDSSAALPSSANSNSTDYTSPSATITSASSSTSSSSSSFSQPWKPSTKSTVSHAPEETPNVPGVILPVVLAGDADDEAVYSVQMSFGHGTQNGDSTDADSRRKARRKPSGYNWNGGDPQTVNLQLDLGSSDMWVASVDCTTSDCLSAPALFNESLSLQAGTDASFQYHNGEVSGGIYWEQVSLGGFGIGYQAFLAADDVSSEDLGGGNFTGVLGLALPANSVITTKIAGSTSGAPDGATFLDNLFGGGTSAPTQRLFSLSLERREDVRTQSTFGIGTVSSSLCPSPCSPTYIPIVAQASLGTLGFLHWRIPLTSISATTWTDQQHGTDPSTQNITLGASIVDTSKQTPLAVLDSGGVAILVGYKKYADAIYAAYGISASADGFYRMPCTTQLALSFTFGNQTYPIHPLDMSWPDPQDPSQTTCIGAIQYSSSLGVTGDFILGSSFLKNVYSIYQYPDNSGSTSAKAWQPTVGMVSLTNASVASQDFYAVRVQRQSLSSVSSSHGSGVGSVTSNTGGGTHTSDDSANRGHVLSSAGIAGVSVVGFFVFAAAAFCAWWFWLRRRFGKNGRVEYTDVALRRRSIGHRSENSSSSLRNKKHNAAQRQKSMVEGYSDYEDSWQSTTEGGDSIRLGYLPEVVEEDEQRNTRGGERQSRGSSIGAAGAIGQSGGSGRDAVPTEDSGNLVDLATAAEAAPAPTFSTQEAVLAPVVPPKSQTRRDSSPSIAAARASSIIQPDISAADELNPPRYPSSYGYPGIPTTSNPRSTSFSMSGPFPSPNRQSLMRPESSPMYDIRSSDYFTVEPAPRGREGRRASGASASGSGSGREGSGGVRGISARRPSGGVLDTPLMEEPESVGHLGPDEH